jgi:hypothetical protein
MAVGIADVAAAAQRVPTHPPHDGSPRPSAEFSEAAGGWGANPGSLDVDPLGMLSEGVGTCASTSATVIPILSHPPLNAMTVTTVPGPRDADPAVARLRRGAADHADGRIDQASKL